MDSTFEVFCTICNGKLELYVLSDGIATGKCPNCCNGGAAIPRALINEAIVEMNESEKKARQLEASEAA